MIWLLLWWLFGAVGSAYYIRQQYDVTLGDAIMCLFLGVAGPITVFSAWLVYGVPSTSQRSIIIWKKKRR